MRVSIIALATTIALSACTQAPQSTSTIDTASAAKVQTVMDESARLNAWFDAKYEAEVLESPINLTYLGRTERKGEIDDFSPEALAKSIADIETPATTKIVSIPAPNNLENHFTIRSIIAPTVFTTVFTSGFFFRLLATSFASLRILFAISLIFGVSPCILKRS